MFSAAIVALALVFSVITTARAAEKQPNVILIITDDQGYGDIAAHGNQKIKTPHLDRLHSESLRLTNFHVDPTCAPTRAALMTGRYPLRSRVRHTLFGRSTLDAGEITLAQTFSENGYRTGLFGKWHLGDNYPYRPQDRGFNVATYHGGGGVGQIPDFWGNDYFDDTFQREDGTREQFEGYCTDVWFNEALKFIENEKEKETPFFCYLATNAPHDPFNVAEEYRTPYLEAGVPETMSSFYGMITNIDENIGRLRKQLDDWELTENTILIFMTDNGTSAGIMPRIPGAPESWRGFNAGMRGAKVSEYDGGHRVPFFIHWPAGKLNEARDIDLLTAHLDIFPTLMELCGLTRADGPEMDGVSLADALYQKQNAEEPFQDRILFVHTQRQQHVIPWLKTAVMTPRWRLVNNNELHDIIADPGQTQNLFEQHPDVVKSLQQAYDQWWESLSPDSFEEYVLIGLGSDHENPVELTCHDWLPDWSDNGRWLPPAYQKPLHNDPLCHGYWGVDVLESGRYEITLLRRPKGVNAPLQGSTARLTIAGIDEKKPISEGATEVVFTVDLPAGETRLQTWLDSDNGESRGAYFVNVKRLDAHQPGIR